MGVVLPWQDGGAGGSSQHCNCLCCASPASLPRDLEQTKPVNQLDKTQYHSHFWQSVVKDSSASNLGAARYKILKICLFTVRRLESMMSSFLLHLLVSQ